jgi:hypothetical protein
MVSQQEDSGVCSVIDPIKRHVVMLLSVMGARFAVMVPWGGAHPFGNGRGDKGNKRKRKRKKGSVGDDFFTSQASLWLKSEKGKEGILELL